jgi:arylsulfatase A-like enzyme
MRRFKSAGHAQRFVDEVHGIAASHSRPRRHLLSAADYRRLRSKLSRSEKKNWIHQRFVTDHYRAIYGVDENLGKVLDLLDQQGQSEDTLIIYTSDNGFFLGEHGWYDKRFMYEPSLRIPLLVRYPRLGVKGKVTNAMAMNIDFAPTILDYAGVEIPSSMQGRSLRPVLEGETPTDWRKSVYYSYYDDSWKLRGVAKEAMADPSFEYFTPHRVGPHRGVRTARHTLIEYYGEGDYWELFDLERDPDQVRNVYSDPGYADVSARLKQELRSLQETYGDRA